MLEESPTYPAPVAHLCLANLEKLMRLVEDDALEWPLFLRLKDAILFQYEGLPRPWQEVVLGVVREAEQRLGLQPGCSPPQ